MQPDFDICMVVHDDVLHDSRIRREAGSLAAKGWRVVVVCIALGNSHLPAVQTLHGYTIWRVSPGIFRNGPVRSWKKLIQLVLALPLVLWKLRYAHARAYHAHDFTGLLITALAGIWRRPVVYDSHELFFDRPFRGVPILTVMILRLLRPLEGILARRAVHVIATSEGHAEGLAKNLGIGYPTLVRNAVDLRTMGEVAARYALNTRWIVAHTGNLFRTRHVIEQVEALAQLPDDVGLVFMGQGPLHDAILERAAQLGLTDRVQIVPPVPVDSVAPTLAQAQAALVLIDTEAPNDNLAVPNKFYEAVAAGVPMVINPTPEVTRLVQRYDLGLACDAADPASIAEALQAILQPENQARYRANFERARAEINWANEERKLYVIYDQILQLPVEGKADGEHPD